jgi:4-cresol dehydrogenase (hydroxylating)
MTHLPPGVSQATFDRALKEFTAVVGTQWAFADAADIDTYRDAYSILWGEPEERIPSAALAPDGVEQVQAIVRIANKYRIPLYPIATGKNLTYGGSAPTLSGSVVLDLKRMNRVLKVDDERNFALVEPGVAYFDLYRHIQDRGLKVWIDCPDPGWGSPVGNSLDHGLGYTYGIYRNHFGAHCGMEIVLPNGELMRTGMGAFPGADTWQDFPYNAGPSFDGIFAQGAYGVVTKMGFRLLPEPECFMTASVMVPKYMDFIALVKETNYLDDSGLIGMPVYFSPVRPRQVAGEGPQPKQDSDYQSLVANGWPSVEAIEAYVARQGKPAFGVQLHFYGPEETCRATWSAAKRRYSAAIPGASFADGVLLHTPLSESDKQKVTKQWIGVPDLAVFAMVSRHAGVPLRDGHADLLPVIPRTGQAVMDIARVMFEFRRKHQMPQGNEVFVTPLAWYPHSFYAGGGAFPTYRNDPEGNRRQRELFRETIQVLAEHGWGDYRTAPAFQDFMVSKYGFNNNALLKYSLQIKDATDPNGIISPGRYGLWPKALREQGYGALTPTGADRGVTDHA